MYIYAIYQLRNQKAEAGIAQSLSHQNIYAIYLEKTVAITQRKKVFSYVHAGNPVELIFLFMTLHRNN